MRYTLKVEGSALLFTDSSDPTFRVALTMIRSTTGLSCTGRDQFQGQRRPDDGVVRG